MDENDLPKKIINVESIEEVDFSAFYLHLWDTYAMAADEELTSAAIAVKHNLLAALHEVYCAA